jgi:hypothetical protein
MTLPVPPRLPPIETGSAGFDFSIATAAEK